MTIDELLSSNDMLTIAEEEQKQQAQHFRRVTFGLIAMYAALSHFPK